MMQKLITSVRVFMILALVLGLIYPLSLIGIGQLFFPHQANGSLLEYHDKIIGSSLIAQSFTNLKYFHSRFSAINYDAMRSGGSNLAASNRQLYQNVKEHLKKVREENNIAISTLIPADMVLNSASGLDPSISLANAFLQLPRVAKHRTLSKEMIKRLIYNYLDPEFVGIWGQSGVNVLELNLALDQLEAKL